MTSLEQHLVDWIKENVEVEASNEPTEILDLGWGETDIKLFVDNEVANEDCWSGIASKFGYWVSFELEITNRYKLNDAKDDERLWIEFEDYPSGWARPVCVHARVEDGADIIYGSLRWLRHPDLNRWMLAFEYLRREDYSRAFLCKHNDYYTASGNKTRVINSGSKINATVLLPPAF